MILSWYKSFGGDGWSSHHAYKTPNTDKAPKTEGPSTWECDLR